MTNEADKPGVRGFFKRLRAKLNVGPAWLTADITELLPGRKIDADILDDLETRLITADVGAEATTRILDGLRRRVARKELDDVDALMKALSEAMVDILKPVERELAIDPLIKPFVILVVGINGAGKTTTIGKLAHRLLAEGRSVMLAAGDTFRAAAREQLTHWAERNRVPIIAGQPGAEPAAADSRPLKRISWRSSRRSSGCSADSPPRPRMKCCWCSTAPSDKTPSRRPSSFTRVWESPAWSSPSSTDRPKAVSCSPSHRSWAFPSDSSASASRARISACSTPRNSSRRC